GTPSPVRRCVGGGRPGRPRCRRSCGCGVVVRWWVVGRGRCPGVVVGPGRTVVVGRRGGGARGPGCSGGAQAAGVLGGGGAAVAVAGDVVQVPDRGAAPGGGAVAAAGDEGGAQVAGEGPAAG